MDCAAAKWNLCESGLHACSCDEVESGAEDSVREGRRILVTERVEDAGERIEYGVELWKAAQKALLEGEKRCRIPGGGVVCVDEKPGKEVWVSGCEKS